MTEEKSPTTEDKDIQAKMAKFEEQRATKEKEMTKVVNFLMSTVGLKTHKAIMMQRSSVEFFRGVNFHIAVLQHGDKIMKMIPSFIEDGSLK